MDEEKQLFNQLNERVNEITARINEIQYLVVQGKFLTPIAAVEVSGSTNVPEGMIAFTIPEDDYVVFKFNKSHVGDFWSNVCTAENQDKYNIDLSKPRCEIFTSDLQSTGFLEWYIPTRGKR